MSDREAFEKWYAEAMGEPNVRRYADSKGVYTHLAMQSAWLGWQAAQAQAQEGDGESVGWQFQHEDTGRTTFVSHAEAAAFEELNSRRWHKTIQLYAAPPAAAVNQQLLEALQAMLEMSEMGGFGKAYAEDLARAAILAAQEQK